MYAQLVQSRTAPGERAERDRIISESLIPALHEEPGFAGTLSLVDRGSGEGMMIVFWDTVEQARTPAVERGRRYRAAIADAAAASEGVSHHVAIWEVGARA
jgi:hypothetical protein